MKTAYNFVISVLLLGACYPPCDGTGCFTIGVESMSNPVTVTNPGYFSSVSHITTDCIIRVRYEGANKSDVQFVIKTVKFNLPTCAHSFQVESYPTICNSASSSGGGLVWLSSGPSVRIQWKSQSINKRAHFVLQLYPAKKVCGGRRKVVDNKFHSDSFRFPHKYPLVNCSWQFESSNPSQVIILVIKTMNVFTTRSCSHELLEIKEIQRGALSLTHRLCKEKQDFTVVSDKIEIYLHTLDKSIRSRSLSILYQACGGLHQLSDGAAEQNITSPVKLALLPPGRKCLWEVRSTPRQNFTRGSSTIMFHNAIEVEIKKLHLETSGKCINKVLIVDEHGIELAKLCHHNSRSRILRFTNASKIYFVYVNNGYKPRAVFNFVVRRTSGCLISLSMSPSNSSETVEIPAGQRCSLKLMSSQSNSQQMKLRLLAQKLGTQSMIPCNVFDGVAVYLRASHISSKPWLLSSLCENRPLSVSLNRSGDYALVNFPSTQGYMVDFSTVVIEKGVVTVAANDTIGTTFTSPVCGSSILLRHPADRVILTSPGYDGKQGEYSARDNCTWVVTSAAQTPKLHGWSASFYQLQVVVHSLDIEDSTGCKYDSLTVGHFKKVCGRGKSMSWLWKERTLRIQFLSDTSLQGRGFKLLVHLVYPCGGKIRIPDSESSGQLKLPSYSEPYPSLDCQWEIINDKTYRSIEIRLVNYETPHPDDKLIVMRMNRRYNRNWTDKMSENYTLTRGMAWKNIGILLSISFKTGNGKKKRNFLFHYNTCGHVINMRENEKIIIPIPRYPRELVGANKWQGRRFYCSWSIIHRPVVTNSTVIRYMRPSKYVVAKFPSNVPTFECLTVDKLKAVHCKQSMAWLSRNFVTKINHQRLPFYKYEGNLVLSVESIKEKCGGRKYATAAIGEFQSPQFTGPYPQMDNCFWEILPANAHQSTILDIQFLQGTTFRDNIHIKAIDQSGDVRKYVHGGNNNLRILSHEFLVNLRIITQNSYQRKISFRFSACGKDYKLPNTNSKQVIESPGKPLAQLSSRINCSWSISPSSTKETLPNGVTKIRYDVLKVNIKHTDFTKTRGCSDTFLELKDDLGLESRKICGNMKYEQSLELYSQKIYINFVSLSGAYGNGFKVEVISVSGDSWAILPNATGKEGHISSPNFPRTYLPNAVANWLFNLTIGTHNVLKLTLRIELLDIESSENCVNDSLLILEGNSKTRMFRPVIPQLCNKSSSQTLRPSNITSDLVILRFQSNAAVERSGFNITFQTSSHTEINECATNNHDCDTGPNGAGECIDQPTGYQCKCRKPFIGNGKRGGCCKKLNFYLGNKQPIFKASLIPMNVTTRSKFFFFPNLPAPIHKSLTKAFYVTSTGAIGFVDAANSTLQIKNHEYDSSYNRLCHTNCRSYQNERKRKSCISVCGLVPLLETPMEFNEIRAQIPFFGVRQARSKVTMIGLFAPQWSQLHFKGDSKWMVYELRNDADIPKYMKSKLRNADIPDVFNASYVIKFNRVYHRNSLNSPMTYYIIIATTFKNTYGFYFYDTCQKWTPDVRDEGFQGLKSGMFFPNFEDNSQDLHGSYSSIVHEILSSPNNPNAQLPSCDRQNRENHTDLACFELSSNPVDYTNPSLHCQAWLNVNKYIQPLFWGYFPQTDARKWCPQNSMEMNFGFVKVEIPGIGDEVSCYQPVLSPDATYGLRPVCCYLEFRTFATVKYFTGTKIKSFFYRATIENENGESGIKDALVTMVTKYDLSQPEGLRLFQRQLKAYKSCCKSEDVSPTLCNEFLKHFPAVEPDKEWAVGGFRGDPHITTLDGLTYSFNGLGQFLLSHGERYLSTLRSWQEFRLVALFQTSRNVSTATVTQRIAAQGVTNRTGNEKTSIVEISILDSDEIEVRIDRSIHKNDTTLRRGLKLKGGASLRFNGEWYIIALPVGLILRTKPVGGALIIDLKLHEDYRNNVSGLMGNNNGNKLDDLRSRDQSITLPGDSKDAAIFPVAMTWAVNCYDPNEALLHYYISDCVNLFNASFRPYFFDLDNAFGADSSLRKAALETCGNNTACLYDVAQTKDLYFGNTTKSSEETTKDISDEESNSPPQFINNQTEIQIRLGSSGSVDVTAFDPDPDDKVTLVLNTNAPWISLEGTKLRWANASDLDKPINVTVAAVDSRGKARSMGVTVKVCLCENKAICKWTTENKQLYVNVDCDCEFGWTGRYCDIDEDGCATKPCFDQCTDVPVEEMTSNGNINSYICSPCPAGYEGDGEICVDIDECARNMSGCQQICRNTMGGFVCSCRPGFSKVDKLCVDNDECADKTAKCDPHSECTNTQGGYQCGCLPGYHHFAGFCQDIDECFMNHPCPAKRNLRCLNSLGSYKCVCEEGFAMSGTGECKEINECHPKPPCDQVCIDGKADFECQCHEGFTMGSDNSSCVPLMTCSRSENLTCVGGTCAKFTNGSSVCVCSPGYQRRTVPGSREQICENVNECLNATLNFCRPVGVSQCTDAIPGYSCFCPEGYGLRSGLVCEDIDECFDQSHSCNLSRSSCYNKKGGYDCVCKPGYTKQIVSGKQTCVDVDECAVGTDKCHDNANCNNIDGSYRCICKPGYEGNGTVCDDVNECKEYWLNSCNPDDSICENTVGSYSCRCKPGFMEKKGSSQCVDMDECKLGRFYTGCWSDEHCLNLPSSYRCLCPDGMALKGDRKSCQPIVKCPPSNNCGAALCAMMDDTETCVCPTGTEFDPVSKNCTDINECATDGDALCPTSRRVRCVNDDKSYHCECLYPDHDEKIDANTCQDKNECNNKTLVASTCSPGSSCENTEFGFSCVCGKKFKRLLNANGECEDINECRLGVHQCDRLATCENVVGGYFCPCPPGYKTVGSSCVDIDECSENNGNCDQLCVNKPGGHQCSCRPGFQRVGDQCIDKDECALGEATCAQICINTPGSYTCVCQPGFEKSSANFSACRPLDACQQGSGCSHLCSVVGETPTCFCPNPSGYRMAADKKTCLDIDECKRRGPKRCGGFAKCVNTEGSFRCQCERGYSLSPDGHWCKDRDGGWSSLSEWTPCSASCGGGRQSASRQCNHPVPVGKGLRCLNSDNVTRGAIETVYRSCNTFRCPITSEEKRYSVYLDFFLTATIPLQLFNAVIKEPLAHEIAVGLSKYCGSSPHVCCRSRKDQPLSSVDDNALTSEDIKFGSDTPIIQGGSVSVSVLVAPTTDPCEKRESTRSRRSAPSEKVEPWDARRLLKVLTKLDKHPISSAVASILMEYHITSSVTIGTPRLYDNRTLATILKETPTRDRSHKSWFIPTIVVLVVLTVAAGVIIFVLIRRRGTRSQEKGEKEDGGGAELVSMTAHPTDKGRDESAGTSGTAKTTKTL